MSDSSIDALSSYSSSASETITPSDRSSSSATLGTGDCCVFPLLLLLPADGIAVCRESTNYTQGECDNLLTFTCLVDRVAFLMGISTYAVRVTARRFLGALASSAESFSSSLSLATGRFLAPEEVLVALLGRSSGFGDSSSMSEVSGVGRAEFLLLKTGDPAVEVVPPVTDREGAGVFCFLGRGMKIVGPGQKKSVNLQSWTRPKPDSFVCSYFDQCYVKVTCTAPQSRRLCCNFSSQRTHLFHLSEGYPQAFHLSELLTVAAEGWKGGQKN